MQPGPHAEIKVLLQRDALTTPWGFRLQGGSDFRIPLVVQKVLTGSPADGELHQGDVILAINNNETKQMTHRQAQAAVKNAGGTMSFLVSRTLQLKHRPSSPKPATGPQRSSAQSYHTLPRPSATGGAPRSQMDFGVDYTRGRAAPPPRVHAGGIGPGGMLGRVNQNLNQRVPHQGGGESEQAAYEDGDYPPRSVSEIQQAFNQPQQPQYQGRSHGSGGGGISPGRKAWTKPQAGAGGLPRSLLEPGWSPRSASNSQSQWSSVRAPSNPFAPSNPTYSQPPSYGGGAPQQFRPQNLKSDSPAWAGSLKSSGGPKPWEMHKAEAIAQGSTIYDQQQAAGRPSYRPQPQQNYRGGPQEENNAPYANDSDVLIHQPRVQNVHYGPGGQEFQQHSVDNHLPTDTATVQHLQYNSPIGLYSRENVQKVLATQTKGKPGDGTLQVTGGNPAKSFNPAQSEVYRFLQEEEERKKYQLEQRGGRLAPSAAPVNSQYLDQSKQSPFLGTLDSRFAGSSLDDNTGTSDF